MKKFISMLFVALFLAVAVFTGISFPSAPVKAEEAAVQGKTNHTVHADIVTIVDETTELYKPIAKCTTEDYYYYSRRWNGMPSVITAGNNIFVAWQTGGVKEPDPDKLNYIVIAASQDGGNTWIDPFIIIDPLDETVQAQVPQFYYNPEGRLFLMFSYAGTGIHVIEFFNMDGDLSDVRYSDPVFTGVKNSSFTKPTLMSDGSVMYVSGTVDSYVFRSEDNGLSFKNMAVVESNTSNSIRVFSESVLIEKLDGTLWHLRRLENAANGGIEQSFSADMGKTWTVAEGNLPSPLTSPGSRFAMQRLQSGNLLFITNAAGMGGVNRTRMTAYMSTDDGASWQYSLLLDPLMTSYPDFWQGEDGKIYIAFDKDRYGEGGIRLTVVTEEDIKAGDYVSDSAKRLVTVTKMTTDYADIKSVNGAFPKEEKVEIGTEVKTVLAKYKTTITVTDEYGKSHEITGKYRVTGYNKDKLGTYKAYFVADLPATLKDSFCMLEFKVTVVEKQGCGSSIASLGGGMIASALGITAMVLAQKKRKK